MSRAVVLALAVLGLAFVAQASITATASGRDVSNIQWAPAAPGANRALNFNVYLPSWPTARFTGQYRAKFVGAFSSAFPGAVWTIDAVAGSSTGVTVRVRAVFSGDANTNWLPQARAVYALLRNGTCSPVLASRAWGLSSVQQVTFPYLVSTGVNSAYQPGQMIHGLMFNLVLKSHNFDWLTIARANALVAPLQAKGETFASNAWKHSYIMPSAAPAVAVTLQNASFSARALAGINSYVQANVNTLWPASTWGHVSALNGAQVLMLGGALKAPPPPASLPPPSPVASPPFPASPATPDSPVPTPDSPVPTPDSPVPTPDSPVPTPDSPVPTPDSPVPTPDSPVPTPDSPVPTPDSPVPTPDSPVPTPDSPVPTPDSPVPTPDSPVPTPDSPVPTPDSPVPTPDSPVPTPDSPVPTPDSPVPTPDSPVPTPDSPDV